MQLKNLERSKRLASARFVLGNVLIVVLAIASFFFGLQSLKMNKETIELSGVHTDLDALLLSLVDSQNGVRGYIITGDPDYLAPYHRGMKDLGVVRGRLGERLSVTGDAANSLNDLIADRVAIMEELVNLQRTIGGAAAQSELREGAGKKLMDQIRTAIRIEGEKIDQRFFEVESNADFATAAFFVLVFVTLVLSAALNAARLFFFRREIAVRAGTETELRARVREINLFARMAEALLASKSRDESYKIFRSYGQKIMLGNSGAIYRDYKLDIC
jgi:CHASE3 domain sensor protein